VLFGWALQMHAGVRFFLFSAPRRAHKGSQLGRRAWVGGKKEFSAPRRAHKGSQLGRRSWVEGGQSAVGLGAWACGPRV
jgi:hypothetical protein